MAYTYGYIADYDGNEVLALPDAYGTFYAWTVASFIGDQFTYENGLLDYPYSYGGAYPGYYYTYAYTGEATVK